MAMPALKSWYGLVQPSVPSALLAHRTRCPPRRRRPSRRPRCQKAARELSGPNRRPIRVILAHKSFVRRIRLARLRLSPSRMTDPSVDRDGIRFVMTRQRRTGRPTRTPDSWAATGTIASTGSSASSANMQVNRNRIMMSISLYGSPRGGVVPRLVSKGSFESRGMFLVRISVADLGRSQNQDVTLQGIRTCRCSSMHLHGLGLRQRLSGLSGVRAYTQGQNFAGRGCPGISRFWASVGAVRSGNRVADV